jgi:tetratricopeptide (TPR) repeat protein
VPTNDFHDDISSDSLHQFTNRNEEITRFKKLLLSAQTGKLGFLTLIGISGIGKTTLLNYLADAILPTNWYPGRIELQAPEPNLITMLSVLGREFKPCVPSDRWNDYVRKVKESQENFRRVTLPSIRQNWTAGSNSILEHNHQSLVVTTNIGEAKQILLDNLREALLELVEYMEQPLCIFLDNYEYLNIIDEHLGEILCGEILNDIARKATQPILVVTSGTQWPYQYSSMKAELNDFTPVSVKDYLEKQHIQTTPELVEAFVELTMGYPLALALATNLFQSFNNQERTVNNLLASTTKSRLHRDLIEHLCGRLLRHLPEPSRDLLRWCPLLRSFNKRTLQILLKVVNEKTDTVISPLTDDQYEHFIRLSFVKYAGVPGDRTTQGFRTLHEMVRRAGQEALADREDQAQQVHTALAADYREQLAGNYKDLFQQDQSVMRIAEISEKDFYLFLEYFYHALQVTNLQASASKQWEFMFSQAIYEWHHHHAVLLLEVVRQLEGEDKMILNKSFISQYQIWNARFLEQLSQWQKARSLLDQAVQYWRHEGNSQYLSIGLNEIGLVYCLENHPQAALQYFEEAFLLRKELGDATAAAVSLNNIAYVYKVQGHLEEALRHCKNALELAKQGDILRHIQILENIGFTYREQQNWNEALHYFMDALKLKKEHCDAAEEIARSYRVIGSIYQKQERWQEAHATYAQSLLYYSGKHCSFREEIADVIENIAVCYAHELEMLAQCYDASGENTKSASYHARAKRVCGNFTG